MTGTPEEAIDLPEQTPSKPRGPKVMWLWLCRQVSMLEVRLEAYRGGPAEEAIQTDLDCAIEVRRTFELIFDEHQPDPRSPYVANDFRQFVEERRRRSSAARASGRRV